MKSFRPQAAEQGGSEESTRRTDSANASSSQPEGGPAGSSAGNSQGAGSTSSGSQEKQEAPRSGASSASGRRSLTGRIRSVFSTIRKEVSGFYGVIGMQLELVTKVQNDSPLSSSHCVKCCKGTHRYVLACHNSV